MTIKNIIMNVYRTSFIITNNGKLPRSPPIGEWINTLWHILEMEYYSTIKKKTYNAIKRHG